MVYHRTLPSQGIFPRFLFPYEMTNYNVLPISLSLTIYHHHSWPLWTAFLILGSFILCHTFICLYMGREFHIREGLLCDKVRKSIKTVRFVRTTKISFEELMRSCHFLLVQISRITVPLLVQKLHESMLFRLSYHRSFTNGHRLPIRLLPVIRVSWFEVIVWSDQVKEYFCGKDKNLVRSFCCPHRFIACG